MRILNIASFSGNLGDNINVFSVHRKIYEHCSEANISTLEIRKFFWGDIQFDSDLVEYINSFDVLWIGGGNYFEVWVEKSRTGMTVDLPIQLLETISIPIVFYGLGYDVTQGYTSETIARAKKWFEYVLSYPEKFKIIVRNDGSKKSMEDTLGSRISSAVEVVPDGGFLYSRSYVKPAWMKDNPYIILNLTGDMLESRFPGTKQLHTSDGFLDEMAEWIGKWLAVNTKHILLLVPHIFKDLLPIYAMLERLPDSIRRSRVLVAPYAQGEDCFDAVMSLYSGATLVLGTRFHANVCAIANGTPVVGLVNSNQIQFLYNDLNLSNYYIDVRVPGFSQKLEERVTFCLDNAENESEKLRNIATELVKSIDIKIIETINWLREK